MSLAWLIVIGFLGGICLSAVMVGSACIMSGQIRDQVAKFTAHELLISNRLRKAC